MRREGKKKKAKYQTLACTYENTYTIVCVEVVEAASGLLLSIKTFQRLSLHKCNSFVGVFRISSDDLMILVVV